MSPSIQGPLNDQKAKSVHADLVFVFVVMAAEQVWEPFLGNSQVPAMAREPAGVTPKPTLGSEQLRGPPPPPFRGNCIISRCWVGGRRLHGLL